MSTIKISVVMCVYNAGAYLHGAVTSILNQEYSNLELVIVNDGSTDESLDVMKQFSDLDERVVIVDQENMGLTKALNVGIEIASGDFIARMDADDISLPFRLQQFVEFLRANNEVDIYSTPALVINENDEVQKVIPNYFRRNGFDQKLLNYNNSMIHGTLIVKSDILKKYRYNEDFKYSQDFELYHRLLRAGFNISYDARNISYQLRLHESSITNTHTEEQIELFERIFKENGIKYYRHSLRNRVYFKLLDVFYFFVARIKKY